MSDREKISDTRLAVTLQNFNAQLKKRLQEKGHGTFTSRHEILGTITEEYQELIEAIQKLPLANVRDELFDIAVACVFGVACIEAQGLDW